MTIDPRAGELLDEVLARVPLLTGMEPRVAVACSGGADSLALLALAARAGLAPIAVHVDHGLRDGSAREAATVADAAARLGARFFPTRVSVDAGPNLEARARDARYAALERARGEVEAGAIVVAHTADDQAETVLLNLLRGSATTGLGGMPASRGAIVRPLLGVRRAETRALCHALGFVPVRDPMNDDLSFRRVWLRREVLPVLERAAARDIVSVLARQSEVLRAESDLLDGLADDALEAARDSGGAPRARALAALPPTLARRALRRLVGAPPPSQAALERVLAVARGERRAVQLAGGRRVTRRAGRLYVEFALETPEREASLLVPFPGRATGLGVRFEAWVARGAPTIWPDGRWTCVLDAAVAGEAGRVEHPGGAPPRLVVARTGAALWTVGYGVDASARPHLRTRRFLWVAAEPVVEPAMELVGGAV